MKLFAAGCLCALASGPANALLIVGDNDPANNTAIFDFEFGPACSVFGVPIADSCTLDVDLSNTAQYDARITGFAFDIYDGGALHLASVDGTLDDSSWWFDVWYDPIPGPGDADAFAITGWNLWGGDPQSGIATGATGSFDFWGLFYEPLSIGNVLVRFQQTGPDGEGSDKGRACTQGCTPPTQVPEPSSLALLGLGLILVGFTARSRRRSAS